MEKDIFSPKFNAQRIVLKKIGEDLFYVEHTLLHRN